VAFLGSSGVGKSTLINELVGEELLATQEIRDIDGKGRHTTTLRELVISPDGVLIIDTPGMRELQPWQADEAVGDVFADIRELTLRCKFSDCSHTTEPGCAVQTALADGSLDLSRWQSYQRLQRETAFEVRRVDRRASQKHKTAWKKITKQLRQRVHEKRGEE
jgi:ribosome biogenesis GTPase